MLGQLSLARVAARIAATADKTALNSPDSALRNAADSKGRLTMDLTEFRASVQAGEPPPVALPLQALWWDAKGDWRRAHECAQQETGPTGAAVHAYLHRKEPDPANARYWYTRAGRPAASGTLEQEWNALAAELLAG